MEKGGREPAHGEAAVSSPALTSVGDDAKRRVPSAAPAAQNAVPSYAPPPARASGFARTEGSNATAPEKTPPPAPAPAVGTPAADTPPAADPAISKLPTTAASPGALGRCRGGLAAAPWTSAERQTPGASAWSLQSSWPPPDTTTRTELCLRLGAEHSYWPCLQKKFCAPASRGIAPEGLRADVNLLCFPQQDGMTAQVHYCRSFGAGDAWALPPRDVFNARAFHDIGRMCFT